MLKPYTFLLTPEPLPRGGCRLTITQTHSNAQPAICPVEAANEDEAIAKAVAELELLVRMYAGLERKRSNLARSVRKTSSGAYEVVFEVDLE